MQPPKSKIDPTKPAEIGKPLNPPAQILRLRFSPDGKVLAAACSDGSVRRWDTSATPPTELPPLAGHNGWVCGLAFAGDALFTSDSWGKLAAWDASGKPRWNVEAAHDGWTRMIAARGTALATCGKDGFVRLWNAKDGAKSGEFTVGADALSVALAPDGESAFAGDLFGITREFEVPSGKVLRTFEAKELHRTDRVQDVGGVRCLLFDASGKTLFAAGAEPKTGGFVECTPLVIAFDRSTGKRTGQWKGPSEKEGYITDLAWHPDGYLVGTSSGQPGQGKVFFWKPGGEQPFFAVPKPNVHSVALSPDGKLMAAALTNANSSGNGKPKGKDGEYPANFSPIQFWQIPKV